MFQKLWAGARSLLTGLKVTARESAARPVTQLYPHTKPEMSGAFRSCIQLVRFPETDSHDCVACMQCVDICPSYCIAIDGIKVEGIKKQRATRFEVDFALCSLCGLCVDVCPTETLEYSKRFDEAGYVRAWKYDLLEDFQAGEERFIEAQRVREAEAAAAKKAETAAAGAPKEVAPEVSASPAPAATPPAPAPPPTEAP